jgi:hypothetical protein
MHCHVWLNLNELYNDNYIFMIMKYIDDNICDYIVNCWIVNYEDKLMLRCLKLFGIE